MISLQEYLANPCASLSIPYWKWKNISLPPDMKIFHNREFNKTLLNEYKEEKYFRLSHDLHNIHPITLDGFKIETATKQDIDTIVSIINSSYTNLRVDQDQIARYTETIVYCKNLWILVKETASNTYVGCGLADYDRQAKEMVLEWIQVLPAYRGRKIGQLLVTELLYRASAFADFSTVSGQVDNSTNPERLYRKCGYVGNDIWHVLRRKPS